MLNVEIPPDMIVLIPAKNEETALAFLLPRLLKRVKQVLVVDNGSEDQTAKVARDVGVQVITEKRPGYGSACLAGLKYLARQPNPPKYVCFFDGDGQSNVADIDKVALPVLKDRTPYCQGSRMIDPQSRNNLTIIARVANRLFAKFLSMVWKQHLTDLGPLRVISWDLLSELNMASINYGWTIEMSTKILKMGGVPYLEVPVNWHPRTSGKSKISGNFNTAFKAGSIMILTLLRVLLFWKPGI
ncbi:MAG: glycosyltransferase family 2 protein [Candidatus Thorarchaeota archaeon]